MQGLCKLQHPSSGAEQATPWWEHYGDRTASWPWRCSPVTSAMGTGIAVTLPGPGGATGTFYRGSASPTVRTQASIAKCLICTTLALSGQVSSRAFLDCSLNLVLSNAFLKSLIKTGLVILHPDSSANAEDLVAFPSVSKDVSTRREAGGWEALVPIYTDALVHMDRECVSYPTLPQSRKKKGIKFFLLR